MAKRGRKRPLNEGVPCAICGVLWCPLYRIKAGSFRPLQYKFAIKACCSPACRSEAHFRARPAAKLTDQQVVKIRQLRAEGATVQSLLATFRLDESAIRAICAGRTWKHVGGPLTPSRATPA